MQNDDGQFDHVKNHLRKVRSHAVQRFCVTYYRLKWDYELRESSDLDPLSLSLSELVKTILQKSSKLSKATAYDHAHAVKFCEMVALARLTNQTVLMKIEHMPIILSSTTSNKLAHLLAKQQCSISVFLEKVIQKEFENTFMV
jgi:hypothetical protein